MCLGKYNSPESKEEYERILRTLRSGEPARRTGPASDVTVAEMMARFMEHARQHYRRPDGTNTDELYNFVLSLKPLRELYAHAPAREFGPKALKDCRRWMIDAGWCRRQINARVGRIRRVFKWAASEELIDPAVYHALATVTGLQAGRTDAVEREPVRPVDDAVVEVTIRCLNRQLAGLVRFMRLTGCRPGEACKLRRADLDESGRAWRYTPRAHKTAHRGKRRVIAVGPQCQELLRGYFTADPEDFVFSPRRAVEELHAARAAGRKTPRYPGHMRRNAQKRKANPKTKPGSRYTVLGLGQGVERAAKRAGVPHWTPNQLRHAVATKVRKRYSLEHAGATLGHTKMSATEVYAERDEALAVKVATDIG